MSILLRPKCAPQELMHLTCAVAAAMCRAVAKIVHEKFTDREAFQFYQELAAQDN